MADACEMAAQFIEGRSRESLDGEDMLAFALARAIEIIGEAASRVSAATRQAHPSLPWAQAMGMRNRLVHAYFSINPDILWHAATVEAPALHRRLIEVLGPAD